MTGQAPTSNWKKVALLGCAILAGLLLVVVGYVAWVTWRALGQGAPEATARVLPDSPPGQVRIELFLRGATPMKVTSVSLARSLAQAIKAQPPAGFVEAPLPDDPEQVPEMRDWAANWNRDNVRWTGSFHLPDNQPTVLSFPASCTGHETGTVSLSCEAEIGLGSTSFAVNAHLGPSTATAPAPPDGR